MNILTLSNFHKICRTCAREEDELISFHENPYLSEMLKLCAQIEFETSDNLPKQICLSCIDELNKTYTFTIKCKMVDAALRNFIQEHDANVNAHIAPEIPENSEFNVFIKTENCENSNDACAEVPNINCNQCSEAFTSLSDLIEHQKLERHFCSKEPTAPQASAAKTKRRRRPRKKEAPESENINPVPVAKRDRTFTCQICNKVMNNLSNFRRHEQIHSGEKKFQCDVCNKHFRHSGTLITHQRSHSGERPCICDVCGKTYVDLSTLGRHKKIHSGEKKFQCDVCNKRFTQSGDLNVHKRLHVEKPFSCEVCLKRFNRRSHLLKHGKVHLKNINGAPAGAPHKATFKNNALDATPETDEIEEMDDIQQIKQTDGTKTDGIKQTDGIKHTDGDLEDTYKNEENEENNDNNENDEIEENDEVEEMDDTDV